MQDLNSMVDYSLRPSHAKISRIGGAEKPSNVKEFVTPGTVAGDYRNFPNVAGAESMHRQMVKRGGAGILSSDAILQNLQNQIVKELKKLMSAQLAYTAAEIVVNLVRKSLGQAFQKSGGLNVKQAVKKTGKVAKKVTDTVLPIALDVGVNTASQLASNAILDPLGMAAIAPLTGRIVGKVARKAIKNKTGYGSKCGQGMEGVGVYGGKKKPVKKSSGTDKRKQRGQIISKLMKEQKLSLADASREASKYMT